MAEEEEFERIPSKGWCTAAATIPHTWKFSILVHILLKGESGEWEGKKEGKKYGADWEFLLFEIRVREKWQMKKNIDSRDEGRKKNVQNSVDDDVIYFDTNYSDDWLTKINVKCELLQSNFREFLLYMTKIIFLINLRRLWMIQILIKFNK